MYRITVSIFATICLIGLTYATECSSGPGYRFPVTCPGLLDSTKSYCCENSGTFHCCDEEEFTLQGGLNDDTKQLELRYKRDYKLFEDSNSIISSADEGVNAVLIVGILAAVIIPLACILCCCCCCACCPCYHWCHPNSTNVTIVQPSFGYPTGNGGVNNFGVAVPTEQAMPKDPPQYASGGYSRLSTPHSDHRSSYIQ